MDRDLKHTLKSDCYRYYKSEKKECLWQLHNPALKYIEIYRKAHYYSKKRHKIAGMYFRIRLNQIMRKHKFQIPYTAEIGDGLCVVHSGRIIVAPTVKMGKNISLFTGVTIGSEHRGKRQGVPTIGNEVWIGPNAAITGKITIGDDVLIAANAFVNFDVPSHSIVIGNPGKIIACENHLATEGYIANRI